MSLRTRQRITVEIARGDASERAKNAGFSTF
jgi:hypothetical protein